MNCILCAASPGGHCPRHPPSLLVTAPVVCRRAGVTYRQLDYWVREGVIACHTPASGSGSQRQFTPEQVAEVAVVADLLRVGFTLSALRPLSHHKRVRLRDAVASALDDTDAAQEVPA